MKKILLGTSVLLVLFTACSEEKKASEEIQSSTQEVKKDEAMPIMLTPSNEELEKEDSMPVLLTPSDEEMQEDELGPKEGEEELPIQDEEPVEQEQGK